MRHVLAFLCLVAFPASSMADQRFLPYIEWLVANSDYEYNGEPLPTIEFMSAPLMAITVYGEATVAQSEMNGTELPNIQGIYLHDRNAIVFPEGTDPWAQEDTIVHELYHFLQYVNHDGVQPDCLASWERPAYEIHWEWVEAHGKTDLYTEPNWLFVLMIELSCTQPHMYR